MGVSGMGMKYGSVARTPYRRAWRKWPISWQSRIVITANEYIAPLRMVACQPGEK